MVLTWCVCDVNHLQTYTRPSRFSALNIEILVVVCRRCYAGGWCLDVCIHNKGSRRCTAPQFLSRKGVVRYVPICARNVQRSGSAHCEQDASDILCMRRYSASALWEAWPQIFARAKLTNYRAPHPHYLFASDAYVVGACILVSLLQLIIVHERSVQVTVKYYQAVSET